MAEEKDKKNTSAKDSAKAGGKKEAGAEKAKTVNGVVPEDKVDATQETPTVSGGNNKTLLIAAAIIIALALIGGTLYMTGALPFFAGTSGDNSKVVATVNGDEITRAELDARILQNKSTYESQGADLDDPAVYSEIEKQALDFMINEKLVAREAASNNISATDEEVDQQFQATVGNFPDETAFEEALKENGLTRDTLRENIAAQLTVQKYFDGVIDEESLVVSEEDVAAFYSEYQTQNPEAPALEELTPQIEELLREQKMQEEVEKILSSLRENAEVEILL